MLAVSLDELVACVACVSIGILVIVAVALLILDKIDSRRTAETIEGTTSHLSRDNSSTDDAHDREEP